MSERWPELERGISSMETHRKHVPLWLYKKGERLDQQQNNIEAIIQNINPQNAQEKREEALSILKSHLSETGKFTVQVETVREGIEDQKYENTLLKGQVAAKDKEKEKIIAKATDEISQVKEVVKKQKRILNKVPYDIIENIQAKQKPKKKDWEIYIK